MATTINVSGTSASLNIIMDSANGSISESANGSIGEAISSEIISLNYTIPPNKPVGYDSFLYGSTNFFTWMTGSPPNGFGLDKSYIVADAALSNV